MLDHFDFLVKWMPKHSYNMLCCYKQYRKSLSVIWIYEFNFFTNNEIAPLNISYGKTESEVVAVQSLSHVWLFATPWTAARQASLSFTIPRSLLKLMFIESVMSSNHLILWNPLLLLPSIWRTNFKSVLHDLMLDKLFCLITNFVIC